MYKLILCLILLSTFSFSQLLSFEKALKETINNNKKIKQQRLSIDEKKEDIKKVSSYSYGKIELSHEMSRTNHAGYVFNSKLSSREASFKDFGFSEFGQPMNTEPKDLNYPDTKNNFNTKITYDIPLFTGFKLTNQKDMLALEKKP